MDPQQPPATHPRRWRGERAGDAIIIGLTAVASVSGTFGELRIAPYPIPPDIWAYLLALAGPAALLFRRRNPVGVAAVTVVAIYVYHFAGYPGGALISACYPAFYSAGAYGRSQGAAIASYLLILPAGFFPAIPPRAVAAYDAQVWGPALAILASALMGANQRRRRIEADLRVGRATEAADARAKQTAAEERLQMARELHDVLAHTISVITVQSGAALDALPEHPDEAITALRTLRAAAKEATAELRTTLGLLRTADGGTDGMPAGEPGRIVAPQPRLEQIDALIEAARTAGLTVRADIGPATTIPPMVQLTAYRIVQEALTNVIRHSGATTAYVSLSTSEAGLLVEVTDDGHGPQAGQAGGFGLQGMRERVAATGGTMRAEPGPLGGFVVRAELPLDAVP